MVGLLALALGCGRSDVYRFRDAGVVPDAGQMVDAGTDAGVPCTPGTLTLNRAVPVVMFVLDRSASMREPFSGRSRWSALTEGLAKALPAVDQSIAIGALEFPGGGGFDACLVNPMVQLAPTRGNVTPLLTLMRNTQPSGATPTALAIDVGGAAVRTARAAGSARALVLATDGAPDCNSELDPRRCTCVGGGGLCTATRCLDDERTVSHIAAQTDAGIPTYVIGIQNVGETALVRTLNAMAVAGGRPRPGTQRYYGVSSQDELDTALVAIRGQVGACVYLSTSVPEDDSRIEIDVAGRPVSFDPSGAEGWSWSDRRNGELEFHGKACEMVISSASAVITASVQCE